MNLPIEHLTINQYAQDKLPLEKVLEWYDGLGFDEKRKILSFTRSCLEQGIDKANGDNGLIEKAIEQIPLKPTMTPIVLLKTKSLKIALNEILRLPDNEVRKGFISLLAIFKVLDRKRRTTECKNGCGHYWHNLDTQTTF